MIRIKYNSKDTFVVVIGANSGIGMSLCKQLLESNVIVFGVDIQEKTETIIGENYTYFQANPLDLDEFSNLIEEIKKITPFINGLVNLSGTIHNFKLIEETSLEEWNQTYDISFKSSFNSVKAFVPLLKKAERASIVNMSSGLAFAGQRNYGSYATAKNAIVSFSRTLATELAPSIRVNTVAPGAVDTNFIYTEDGSMRFDKDTYEKIVPLGTIAKPKEISQVILFLLSEGASHITGQSIHINGGAMML